MRKVILSMTVTLDGFVAGPNGEMDWVTNAIDEEIMQYIDDQLPTKGAILLGGVTYRDWSQYWPSETGSIADKINAIPKIVFSRRLEKAEWGNARLVRDHIPEEIQRLKG
jgi:dihydrofolate reductase